MIRHYCSNYKPKRRRLNYGNRFRLKKQLLWTFYKKQNNLFDGNYSLEQTKQEFHFVKKTDVF